MMRFAIEERDSAIESMLEVVSAGPMDPVMLIDIAANRTEINKSTVLAGWLHLVNAGVLRWGQDGRVTMETSAPALSPNATAIDVMREHFKREPGPIPEVKLLRDLHDQYGVADAALRYAKHELRGTGEVVFRYVDRKGCLAAGPRLNIAE